MGQRDFTSNYRFIKGPVERFDQKNEMFKRPRWDPTLRDLGRAVFGEHPPRETGGYSHRDRALQNAAWYLESAFANGVQTHDTGLYSWGSRVPGVGPLPSGLKLDIADPAQMSRQIKRVARFLGASLVGICELDRRWTYSHTFHMITREHAEFEVPEDYRYAIALAVEMDYELMKTSPTCLEGAATGLGYSEMAYVAGLLAEFIRGLGYKAIPSGNDTALSIPIAVDAGLGELGRHGILITEEYGPRVRLCKVLTDMPLAPDNIHEFGAAEFCEKCKKCARLCPGQAISHEARTDKPNSISNNSGVMKWPVDAEKCFGFWARNGASCGNCIRVCPFNKPKGWLHNTVRWGVKCAPWANPLFVWGDDVLGYGKRADPAKFWEA